jgi:hypothetical protein
MRFVAMLVVVFALPLIYPRAYAFGVDDKELDDQSLSALEAKADQAQPRDQCFLYAELVHQMTERAGHQLNSGDSGQASATLKLVQHYAEKIHIQAAEDSKKLKNAELLLQHTSWRLKDILGSASYDDRDALEATMKQLDQVQTQLMMQVFKK